MKQKKPFYTAWWFWVIVVIVFMSFITPKKEKTPVEETKEVVEDPQEEQDPITSIVESQKIKSSDLKVETTGDTATISLHFDGTSWDETDFVRQAMSQYINICQQAYEIEGIETVDYSVYVDLMDAKGNEAPEKGFEMSMPKSSFTTYNWENLKFMPDSYTQIEADSEIYIHPGIKQNVDFSKVYYRG